MTTAQLKEACMSRARVIARRPHMTAVRFHHIEAIVHKPDYKTGKWICCAVLAYGEEAPFTYYGYDDREPIPAQFIELDDNPHGNGFTAFLNFRDELKSRAERLTIKEGA